MRATGLVLVALWASSPALALAQNLELETVTAAAVGTAGSTLHIDFDVIVSGGLRAPFTWSAHLSPTGALAGARSLGTYGPVRPTADGRMRVSGEIALPADVGGSYYLVVDLDPANVITQTNDLDDALATNARSRVVARLADVRIRAVRLVTPRAKLGDAVNIDVDVFNAGSVSADVELLAVADRDGTISVEDAEVGRTSVTLAAGASRTVRLSGALPGSLKAGDHYFGVIADPAQQLEENAESNNLVIAAAQLLVFEEQITLSTMTLPNGTVFQPYYALLAATGGDGHYRFAVSRGRIPAGLALDAIHGVLSGAPLSSGPQELTIEVRSNGLVAERVFNIAVAESGLELAVVTPELPRGTLGLQYESALEAAGGEPPYVWTLLSGALPAGLDLATNGRIRGVPSEEGTYGLSVEVRDALGGRIRRTFELVIEPANVVILTLDPPPVNLGEPLSITLDVKGGQAPYEWTARSTPPPGLSLSEDGLLSGIPAKVGRFAMRVEVLDARENRQGDTALVIIEVLDSGQFELLVPEIPSLSLRESVDVELTVVGGKPPFTWRVDPRDQLPSGFKLEPAALGEGTARLSGSSIRAIDRAFLLEVTDKTGRVRSAVVALHVDQVSSSSSNSSCASVATTDGSFALSLLVFGLVWVARRRAL